jgi:hypothetical protein
MSKRIREGTPCKTDKFKILQEKMGKDFEAKIANLNGALGNVKHGSMKDLKENVVEIFKKFMIPVIEQQCTTTSDLISEIINLENIVEELKEEKEMMKDRIKDLENCREKSEVKTSRKDMSEKVAQAAKQFKVMDVDFEAELTDRKELLNKAKEKVRDRIRADKKVRYDELIRKATVQVLARSTVKRKQQETDKDIWTAPILVTVDNRENRWELEDILRQCKVYPTFHWNREMVGPVKELRGSLKEKYDDKHYVRIRPEEREGKWRIKADIKLKDSNDRFRLGASWDVPPMCLNIRKVTPGWDKPTWAQVVAAEHSPNSQAMED